MFSVSGTNITLTRGDTLIAQITIKQGETDYTPVEGDVIRFAMKHPIYNAGRTDYSETTPVLTKTIPNDTLILTLLPADTKQLGFGEYVYDIQLTFADGTVDTFIKGKFFLTEEVD